MTVEACQLISSLLISAIPRCLLHGPDFTPPYTWTVCLGPACASENAGLDCSRASGHVLGQGVWGGVLGKA